MIKDRQLTIFGFAFCLQTIVLRLIDYLVRPTFQSFVRFCWSFATLSPNFSVRKVDGKLQPKTALVPFVFVSEVWLQLFLVLSLP